ncbi:2Fe-2S iron-sulfur cluster-binding protein [Paracoccus sp. J55]|uniref:2Fe-2S iron-sulfur cluster-binding protein n=1 Tax=Paracoccus sp. J55 TaxID=935849 RepID=UPI00048E4646|nr:2Fe-2S iron-sulfur cluster-binding protein [Paracoccus sp. J55]
MIKITFLNSAGVSTEVEAHPGDTAMQVAVDNLVPGIAAECGGACSCATCHVVVDSDWIELVGYAEDMEKDLLESLDGAGENSRLCCQIELTRVLDGLILQVPQS